MQASNAALVRLSDVESLRARAVESGRADDFRAYVDRRNRYRSWTLQRLAKIEAGEESERN